jgi:hypothetical protein
MALPLAQQSLFIWHSMTLDIRQRLPLYLGAACVFELTSV